MYEKQPYNIRIFGIGVHTWIIGRVGDMIMSTILFIGFISIIIVFIYIVLLLIRNNE